MASANGSSTRHFVRERTSEVTANHAEVTRSAVRFLDADQARLERAAVQRLRANQVEISNGAVGFARFEQGTIRQSNAGIVVARSVALDEVHVGILAAPVVRGDVHTWLDLRSAVAIGFGMVLGKAAIAAARALARRVLA
ncbi:MAG: hypothetical protein C0506_01655 [Anaerolinea sp.]|nr:hypothetical protein [Anaerolinea sp.]